jgi:hypothetical protein
MWLQVIICTMSVHWRERDWSQLRDVVAIEEPGVHATLAACGLLKFFECPLIRAQEYLLQFLIRMWSPDLHCFMVRGEQIAFTAVEDIYFLTGLPFRGTPLPAEPVLPADVSVSYLGPEVLFEGELHVRLHSEYRGDGCFSSSLCSSDDCEGIWVPRDSADQWWSAEGYGEGTGQRAFFLGFDAACQDGRAAGQMSDYRLRGLCLWVHRGGLVFGEGVDVAP